MRCTCCAPPIVDARRNVGLSAGAPGQLLGGKSSEPKESAFGHRTASAFGMFSLVMDHLLFTMLTAGDMGLALGTGVRC